MHENARRDLSYLLGTDCRSDAIERATLGLYEDPTLKVVRAATRAKYFEPVGALRRPTHWRVADLLAGVENGPWDIVLWRNAAIYLESRRAETIWRQLAAVLAPQGVLVVGKADRPPSDVGLLPVARRIYRRADGPVIGVSGRKQCV